MLAVVGLFAALAVPSGAAAARVVAKGPPAPAALRPAGAARASATPAAGGLVGTRRCRENERAGTMTFVSPFGYDASAGILDVVAAKSLGYFREMCLKVDLVLSSYAPYELVSAGRGTITGQGSAADFLVGVAHGERLVAIATYGDTSDYALLTWPSITRLAQLEGKVVGYHTVLPVILEEMLERAGVELSKLHLVDDLSYDPDLLPQGKFAGLQAYRSNEPITLREQHLAFREWIPSRFGVRGTFNVQVVNQPFLDAHPAAVADFLRAELHAFDYCAVHAVACVRIEQGDAGAAGASYSFGHSLAEWRFEVALAEHNRLPGAGVGVQSEAEWAPEVRALGRFKILRHVPPLATYEDTALAASLYSGTSLIWPGP